ncbi:MAG: DUF3089 domain-containing protein [Pseudomonadota bacterium]
MTGSRIAGMGAAAAIALALTGAARGQTPAAAPNDYARPEAWLCLPGRADACADDLSVTVVAADGTLTAEGFQRAADPKLDCFYVYPTVSMDPGGNSDMVAGREEIRVANVQYARFASVCRTFAPLYRQFTLTALTGALRGQPVPADRELPYTDVRDAWRWYLANENHGRGVVLIGHSQGSGVLMRLIREEIDGKPAQALMAGAILAGWSVPVKDGRFGSIPLCGREGQTGCLVSYVSFRDTLPPAPASIFGKVSEPGATAACVNPAALGGGRGDLQGYHRNVGRGPGSPLGEWATGATVTTPWVATPGLLTAECVTRDGATFLSVHVNADPADPRTDEVAGDTLTAGRPDPIWGLHLVDMHIAMGDLVRIVRAQGEAWPR